MKKVDDNEDSKFDISDDDIGNLEIYEATFWQDIDNIDSPEFEETDVYDDYDGEMYGIYDIY